MAGGGYKTVEAAQRKMTGVKDVIYKPAKAAAAVYAELYRIYRTLHDAFGTAARLPLAGVMKDLIAIRDRARRGRG